MKTIDKNGFWTSDEKIYHVCSLNLCNWISYFLNKKHLLHDFGCGLGHYLKNLNDLGFSNMVGYEGKTPMFQEYNNIVEQDLSKSFSVDQGNVLCLEVGEHIPKEYETVFLDNICNACNNKLILSWAVPGQDGDGHVNCLDNQEVIKNIESRNFRYLEKESLYARSIIEEDLDWLKNTIMVFEKC